MRVKLWIKNALTYALCSVAGAMVYALIMFLMQPDFEIGRLLDMASGYLVGIGVVMSVVVGIVDYKTTLPLALSFGSTRKEALAGMQLGRLVYGLVFLAAVTGLCGSVEGPEVLAVLLPIAVCVVLVMSAMGAALGMVVVKFGKEGGVITGVLIGLLTAGCMVVAIGSAGDMTFDASGWMLWLVPAVGAVLYGLVLIPEVKFIYNCNVKL